MALDYKSYAPFTEKAKAATQNIKRNLSAKTPSMSAGLAVGSMIKSRASSNLPTSMSSLGTQTTSYGGSTKFEKFHPGVDIANKIGTPVPAMTSGTVVESVTGKRQGDKGYGNYVVIKDEQGNLHRYSHLNDEYVQIGSQVQKGNQIGSMGNTGSTYSVSGGTGSHLDYRVVDLYGKYVDPYQFLK